MPFDHIRLSEPLRFGIFWKPRDRSASEYIIEGRVCILASRKFLGRELHPLANNNKKGKTDRKASPYCIGVIGWLSPVQRSDAQVSFGIGGVWNFGFVYPGYSYGYYAILVAVGYYPHG